jgi:spermidine/putrescine transport system ATP-binding protein
MTPLVSIQQVSHGFGAGPVLQDVTLDLAPGSYTVLLGPSGSGKTTLLSVLGGFLTPERGRVLIGGQDCTALAPARRPTATVFQDYALFPHMSVGANVGFGLRMRGVGRAERDRAARAMLETVGLGEAFARKPHQLSGGQRQRVALARALLVEPAVLLLDEPLGALDLKLRRQMQDELKAIQRRVGTAFIHVTHDQEEAMALADHIVVMNRGRIEDEGTPERVYQRPRSRFTATFMGESSILPGRTAQGVITTAAGSFPAPPEATAVAVRPEHVALGGDIPATVTDVVFQGSYKRVTARVGDSDVLARVGAETPVAAGEAVRLAIDARHVIVLRD